LVLTTRRLIIYLFVIFIGFYSIAPIYFIGVISLSWQRELLSVPSPLYPENPTIANYLRNVGFSVASPFGENLRPAGQWRELIKGMINSAIIGVPVTVITMGITVPGGYILGRYRIRRKNLLIGLLLGSRTIPPVAIVVPYYMLYLALGLKGTYLGLVLIHLTITIPLMTWILMGFFATLPRDLEKAARMDGCGRLQAFLKVVLPMAKPAIATTSILTFLYSWNEFLFGNLLSGGGDVQPFTPFLFTFFRNVTVEPTLAAAAIMMNMIPALLVAAVLQRYIIALKIVDPGAVVL
jgi:multiple sugar transport system permease protein